MVKKLFKHELISYLHTLPIVYIVLFGIGLMGRFIRAFEDDSTTYVILNGSASAMLFIASFAAVVLTTVFCLIRFYKNLFSGEGYLTLTLPVSVESHLFVKTIGALIANVATALAIALAVCTFFAGDWLHEIIKALLYLFKYATMSYGTANMILYVGEILLLMLTMTLAQLLTFYMCICIGQSLRRGRIIAAIGIYYGLTLLTQGIGTALLIAQTFLEDSQFIIHLNRWIIQHKPTFVHLILCGIIVLGILWSGICFLISRAMMKKRLNLE